jgi:hypothetical protein
MAHFRVLKVIHYRRSLVSLLYIDFEAGGEFAAKKVREGE